MSLDNRYGAFIDPGLEVQPLARGSLDGVTFAVKDVFAIKGHASSAGNPDWLLSHSAAAEHAEAVRRLLMAGAALRGAAHTDELMYSLGGENVHYGTPVNPRGKGRIPGGSSSGSAVAVAAGSVDCALGTDTGGSIRVPSAYCGIYGFRPSHGAVEMSGVIPLAPQFDTVGWMAGSPELLLRVGKVLLEGMHRGENTAETAAGPDAAAGGEAVLGMKNMSTLFVARDAWSLAEPESAGVLSGALKLLQAGAGRSMDTEVAPEGLKAWMDVFRELQGSEIWETHGSWVRKQRPTFGPDIAARFALAEELYGQNHDAAESFRKEVAVRLGNMLGEDGALVIPTVPGAAPLSGGDAAQLEFNRSGAMSLCCIAGLAGLPQITLPVNGPGGLPLGLSIIGGFGQDLRLLAWANQIWKPALV
ncbi:amidase [Paenibacillus sp. URB8-2]|uniref:amidase n=1 Tax=Paenibacillus sp. URB8-2 TaxID=2741301 RepID=UPI0015B824B0|nr:amidase [Paenibacillus sp. URB8-2]BCG57979.1 amidase [Paenibacillus sp. URB8-2]